MDTFKIGSRVQIDRHRATVKYIGAVDGHPDTWVGLDWDDVSRGKHSGTHNGKIYFICSGGRASGSFVRAKKLHASANLGISVSEALQAKYRSNEHAEEPIYIGTSKSNKVAVQLVGSDKVKRQQGRLEQLCEAAALDMCVSSAGPPGELRSIAPRIQGLDLSGNLLSTWDDVERLLEELPVLRSLVLSSNRLALPDSLMRGNAAAVFPVLQRLVLNHTGVSFGQFLNVIGSLPSLEEVHLCGNQITDLSLDPGRCQQLTNLKVLALEDNAISSWAEVTRLRDLPLLERLMLSNNPLQTIEIQRGQEQFFPFLSALFLGGNEIKEWSSVDALDLLPQLRNVRLSDNPLPGNEDGSSRYQIIARVGQLTSLNGSFITASERRDCELRYLREIIGQQQALQGAETAPQQAAGHPRMAAILARYGDVGGAAPVDTTAKSLGAGMLQVHLVCGVAGKSKRITKKLPGSLTVAKLKVVCERLFTIPSSRQVIQLKSSEDNAAEDVSTFDDRDLNFFDIQAGAEIVVSDSL